MAGRKMPWTTFIQEIRIHSFFPVLDDVYSNLERTATVVKRVANHFSFLIHLEASREQVLRGVKRLEQEYPEDVDRSLVDELMTFRLYVKQSYADKGSFNHQQLYQIIKHEKIQAVFPNVKTILRLFLRLMVTSCSSERSFSKLKRIKSVLRSTVTVWSEYSLRSDLLILMTPVTNSQPGKLEGRYFGNKLPTCRNYILAYHKYVKSLIRLTWKHDNLIIWLFCVNNKLVDQWSVSYDLKTFSTNFKTFWQFSNINATWCSS